MNNIICLLIVLSFSLTDLFAQDETRAKYLGVGIGSVPHFVYGGSFDFIRPSNDNEFDNYFLGQNYLKYHLDLNYEVLSKNQNFGFVSGLKISQVISDYFLSSPYFYINHRQSDTSTEYLRAKAVYQRVTYVGIPINVRWFFYELSDFRFYFKTGFEFNFKVESMTDVDFVQESSNQFNDEIADKFGQINPIMSLFNLNGGATYVNQKQMMFSFEVVLVSAMLTKNTTTLGDVDTGVGVQISAQFPIKISD